MTSTVGSVAWQGFKLAFGLISLAGAWTSAVVKNGALWAKDSEEEKRELGAAQDRFWNLEQEPLPGLRHAFFTTSNGTRLHYVVNEPAGSSAPKDVAIFIHGFPDSFVLWRHFLQSSELQRNHILIAVDLPGYGGSDSLPAYGPNEVFETLCEFIIGVRQLFLQEGKKTVLVTHDWGAVIGARLASEAHVLADHWIITGGIIPSLQASNGKNRILLAKQMLKTWIRSPLNIGLLKNGLSALRPVVSQFRRSFYIFVFHLPWPFSNTFATFGNYWFLRVLHDMGKGPRTKTDKTFTALNPVDAGEAMAISTGPGLAQLEKGNVNGDRYGESVRRRTGDRGMSEKIRIYRENLVFGKWEKSLETTAALFNISSNAVSGASSTSSGVLSNTAPKGALKAPATIILGERDPAFDRRLALDNARDYLVKGSQVVIIKGAGHWLPLEQIGRRALEKTVLWALHDDVENESIPFEAMSDVRVLEAL
ncbi:alpha/beta-hydrolase [Decorospora gaudefroyi]|uniref:Alpha/beta-hydrolase n=1 Tax=Decorospora gaudefroyi TaxID=184978 RepID=A0A6A5K645_9PLEO|nr:alpha/beta-hydrolase [Decorospora gaudefroyi]